MLRIRLTRTGKRNQPHYRIIVTEKRSKRDGDFLENLGYYIPYSNPAKVKLDTQAYQKWIDKGAQPTEVVSYLRASVESSEETELPKKPKTKKSKKAKAKEEATKQAEAEASSDSSDSQPAEAKTDEAETSKSDSEKKEE